jgi:hypothetical protein
MSGRGLNGREHSVQVYRDHTIPQRVGNGLDFPARVAIAVKSEKAGPGPYSGISEYDI